MPLPGARSLRGAWGPDGGSWESRSPSCGSSRGLLSGVFFTLVKTPKQATPAPDAPTCSSFPHFHILCLSAPTSTSLRARWSAAPAVATGWCRVLVLGPGLHLAPGDRARPPVPAGPPPPRTRRTGDPWPAASPAGWAQGPKSAWAWKHLSLPSRAGERPRRQRANGFPPLFFNTESTRETAREAPCVSAARWWERPLAASVSGGLGETPTNSGLCSPPFISRAQPLRPCPRPLLPCAVRRMEVLHASWHIVNVLVGPGTVSSVSSDSEAPSTGTGGVPSPLHPRREPGNPRASAERGAPAGTACTSPGDRPTRPGATPTAPHPPCPWRPRPVCA